MKKIFFLLFLVFILSACSPQVTVTSAPTECCAKVTVTLAPPTQTPIPTPTLHPAFVQLQNLIADSGETVTLLPNGQIEENGVAIPNLQVDQNGQITILVEGESVIVNSADITFEDGFQINGYELDENGAWVEAEVRQFAECSFADFKSCPVAIEDISAKQDYVRSLVTPEMFNLDNLKFTKMNVYNTPFGTLMSPDVETAPNYSGANAERAPFIKDNN